MKDRRKDYSRYFGGISGDLAKFNAARAAEFSRGPDRDKRLPIQHTMVGGDIPENDEL